MNYQHLQPKSGNPFKELLFSQGKKQADEGWFSLRATNCSGTQSALL
jgi:hypothetical protein